MAASSVISCNFVDNPIHSFCPWSQYILLSFYTFVLVMAFLTYPFMSSGRREHRGSCSSRTLRLIPLPSLYTCPPPTSPFHVFQDGKLMTEFHTYTQNVFLIIININKQIAIFHVHQKTMYFKKYEEGKIKTLKVQTILL